MTSQEYVAGLFDLTGHVGIITGASRGLGLGQAKVLTDAGAKVYNFDIAPHSDEETIREGSLIDVICDVTDYEKVKKEVEAIAGQEGHLDFLINNAGITYKSRAEEFPEDRLDKILLIKPEDPSHDGQNLLSVSEGIRLHRTCGFHFVHGCVHGFHRSASL